jgi:hypothetical protein
MLPLVLLLGNIVERATGGQRPFLCTMAAEVTRQIVLELTSNACDPMADLFDLER